MRWPFFKGTKFFFRKIENKQRKFVPETNLDGILVRTVQFGMNKN